MKNKKGFSLASVGFTVSALFIILFILTIIILHIIFEEKLQWGLLVLSVILLCLFMFCLIFFFKHKIIVDNTKKVITIHQFKTYIFSFEDIEQIYASTEYSLDENRYCHIIVVLKDGNKKRFDGYSSILKKNENVEKTKQIIRELNSFLKK